MQAYSHHMPAVQAPLWQLPAGPAWTPPRNWIDTPAVRAVIRQAELMRPRIPERMTCRTRNARLWSIRRGIKDRPHILPNMRDLKTTWRAIWG